ncbi:MAG: alpha-L-fucosidase [Bryobacterales bacterium]|nr:alpha-L-fucosidase [Bryobacterales bacterium]
MRRRAFIAAAGGLAGCSTPLPPEATPPYLLGQQPLYEDSPRRAAAQWFRSCRLGLHLEYGVFSQLRRGPAVQFDERIPPAQYARLRSTFDPGGFDAERLADLAAACGMDYIGLTARGADGFCLFRTVETDFNSLEASGRDLLGELCQACRNRCLGLVVSFSYAADWRHPYFYPAETARTGWQGARPAYESAPAEYRFEKDEDFLLYIRHVHRQLREVVYRYRPLAAIRLEPGDGYHARPDLFPVAQTYSLLREARSGLLVAFGLGASGDEDFAAAEGLQLPRPATAMAAQAWDRNREKPLELALTLAGGGRPGARALLDGYRATAALGARLLVRLRLRADGSPGPAAVEGLRSFAQLRAAAPGPGPAA